MGRAIQPVAEIDHRIPRAGKIRIGAKTEKAMKALTKFRFTSPHRDCIDAIAGRYGGTTQPFNDPTASPPNQHEVYTDADRVDVGLVPQGYSTQYELWSKGGMQRRCDGKVCEIPMPVGDNDYEMEERPCLCMIEGTRSCEVKTRIAVLLAPDVVPMRGLWVLETKSWNAAAEVPGMHDLICSLSPGGMVRAQLGIEQRTKVVITKRGPQTRKFIVPTLTVAQTPDAMLAGANAMRAIGGSAPLLPSQRVATALALNPGVVDDDVVEAEIVDEDFEVVEDGLRNDADQFGLDPLRFVAAMLTAANTKTKAHPDPSRDVVLERLRLARQQMADETRVPLGFSADGSIQWRGAK